MKIKATLGPPRIRIKTPAPFPATVAGTGGIKVSKSGGVWTIAPDFSQLASVLASAVGDPTTKEIWLWDPVTDDYNVLTLAGLGDALFKLTSTTSLAIGTGSKVFTTQPGKDVAAGSWVLATSDASPTANWMLGQVTAYVGASLTVSVSVFAGSGTFSDWTIRTSGARGPDRSAGLSYKWSTGTSAADPGAGFVGVNDAAFGAVTAIHISETDGDGNAMAAEIATWGAGSSAIKGRLKIYDPITPTNFMTFDVTARTDNGGWDTLAVSPVANGGGFSASLYVRCTFAPTGDKGSTGDPGNATLSGVTTNGVVVASGPTTATSTAAMTNGQLLVGQTGAAPEPRTISGDLTIDETGAAAAGASVLKKNTTATITVGYTITPANEGTKSSGTFTPDPATGNYKYYTNNGAHTLAAPTSDCAIDILITNGASAGAITFSGFSVSSNVGDAATTINGHRFVISIRRINSVATYTRKALQ